MEDARKIEGSDSKNFSSNQRVKTDYNEDGEGTLSYWKRLPLPFLINKPFEIRNYLSTLLPTKGRILDIMTY